MIKNDIYRRFTLKITWYRVGLPEIFRHSRLICGWYLKECVSGYNKWFKWNKHFIIINDYDWIPIASYLCLSLMWWSKRSNRSRIQAYKNYCHSAFWTNAFWNRILSSTVMSTRRSSLVLAYFHSITRKRMWRQIWCSRGSSFFQGMKKIEGQQQLLWYFYSIAWKDGRDYNLSKRMGRAPLVLLRITKCFCQRRSFSPHNVKWVIRFRN